MRVIFEAAALTDAGCASIPDVSQTNIANKLH
jgi:hypothetical protein